jgi:hypothetical protein
MYTNNQIICDVVISIVDRYRVVKKIFESEAEYRRKLGSLDRVGSEMQRMIYEI